jgi:hypothetical protein
MIPAAWAWLTASPSHVGTAVIATAVIVACACLIAFGIEDRRDRRARADMPLVYRDQAGHEAWVRSFRAEGDS